MNDATLTELKVVVERAVRPVRASNFRKRRIREELLGHLTTIYEDELGRLGDERAALEQARQRFGDPSKLARELQEAVPKRDRVRYLFDKLEYRPGESLLHLSGKHFLFTFAAFAMLLLLTLPAMWIRGRASEVGLMLHIMLVLAFVSTIFSFLCTVLGDRITRARYGIGSERSLRVMSTTRSVSRIRSGWYSSATEAASSEVVVADSAEIPRRTRTH